MRMHDPQPRTRTLSDPMDPARARAMQAALGHAPSLASGDRLPPFFHHLYFWDPVPPQALGPDGHARTGSFIPDMGLARRMWAAGRLVFHAPLIAGTRAQRISMIESVTRKEGRARPLAFVRLRHDIRQRHSLVLSEWQELVYRQAPGPATPAPRYPASRTDEDHAIPQRFDSTLLFRYSALTFNGHRIHYDEAYARQTEGYDGLVVHGPLLAQYLMLMAQDRRGAALTTFSYRATAPLMHHETATLCWKDDGTAWVRGPDGRQCMLAQAG